MKKVSEGHRFIIQIGDCSEVFDECNEKNWVDKFTFFKVFFSIFSVECWKTIFHQYQSFAINYRENLRPILKTSLLTIWIKWYSYLPWRSYQLNWLISKVTRSYSLAQRCNVLAIGNWSSQEVQLGKTISQWSFIERTSKELWRNEPNFYFSWVFAPPIWISVLQRRQRRVLSIECPFPLGWWKNKKTNWGSCTLPFGHLECYWRQSKSKYW